MKKKVFLSDMGFFSPSDKEPHVEFVNSKLPTIYIKPEAYIKMGHLVDISPKEVGWLGTVSQIGEDYLIEDIFLFEQEVSAATTAISEDGLSKFAEEKFKLPNGVELMNKLRFWGHSHVHMDTFASGQDNSQMDVFKDCGHPFFIRGIFNKKGSIYFTIYNYEKQYSIHHAKWMLYFVHAEDIRETLQSEYDAKVSETTVSYSYKGGEYSGSGGYYGDGRWWDNKDDDYETDGLPWKSKYKRSDIPPGKMLTGKDINTILKNKSAQTVDDIEYLDD